MVVSSAFFARSAQSAQNAAAERGVTNATGVRCFKLPQATPKSVFAMPRTGKVRDVICASAPHQGQGQRDTPSGVGMVKRWYIQILLGGCLPLVPKGRWHEVPEGIRTDEYPSPKFLDRFGTVLEVARESISAPFPA